MDLRARVQVLTILGLVSSFADPPTVLVSRRSRVTVAYLPVVNYIQQPLPEGSTTGATKTGQAGALGMGQQASTGLTTFNQVRISVSADQTAADPLYAVVLVLHYALVRRLYRRHLLGPLQHRLLGRSRRHGRTRSPRRFGRSRPDRQAERSYRGLCCRHHHHGRRNRHVQGQHQSHDRRAGHEPRVRLSCFPPLRTGSNVALYSMYVKTDKKGRRVIIDPAETAQR